MDVAADAGLHVEAAVADFVAAVLGLHHRPLPSLVAAVAGLRGPPLSAYVAGPLSNRRRAARRRLTACLLLRLCRQPELSLAVAGSQCRSSAAITKLVVSAVLMGLWRSVVRLGRPP